MDTSSDKSYLPTSDEIKPYNDLCYYITPKIIPDEVIDKAKEAAFAMYRGEVDQGSPEIIGPANTVFTEDMVLMNNEYASLQKKEIAYLVRFPMISENAAKLAETDEIRLFADALMCKFPAKQHDNGAFGWHTDGAYWPSCSSDKMITAWIPFQDVTLDMGPLHFIENSHKWVFDENLRKFCAAGNKILDQLIDFLDETGKTYRNIPLTLKKGQVSFHHTYLFHGSSPNTSNKDRMTLPFICRIRKTHFNHHSRKMANRLSLAMKEFVVKTARETQITETGLSSLCFGHYRNKKRLGYAHAR